MSGQLIINIYEGINGESLKNMCFNESEASFNVKCFKFIPLLIRAYKLSNNLFSIKKALHGNISLDTI